VSKKSPNPRLQRTRFALLRSPLSRKPLGRVVATVALVLGSFGCGSDDEWTGVNVGAMEDWVDASVSIDGHRVGKLDHLMLHDTIWEKGMKKAQGDSPLFHMVALNIPFDRGRMKHGVHTVRIEKAGHPVVQGEFTFPDPRGSSVQHLWINGQTLENNPGPDAYGSLS